MRLKSAVLLSAICVLIGATMIIALVVSGPPYYHEEGNVNYPGAYFESVYMDKGIEVDDYVTIIDLALLARGLGTSSSDPWGVGWDLFNPDADVSGPEGTPDGYIDLWDLVRVAKNLGLNYYYSPFEVVPGKPKVKVVVPARPINVGEQFAVDIKIANVGEEQGVNTYELTLSWKPELAAVISVVGGGFISGAGENVTSFVNNDEGYLYVGDLLSRDTQSGSGILVTITFECLGKGKTALDLSSRLFDIDLNSIPHKDFDGVIKQH